MAGFFAATRQIFSLQRIYRVSSISTVRFVRRSSSTFQWVAAQPLAYYMRWYIYMYILLLTSFYIYNAAEYGTHLCQYGFFFCKGNFRLLTFFWRMWKNQSSNTARLPCVSSYSFFSLHEQLPSRHNWLQTICTTKIIIMELIWPCFFSTNFLIKLNFMDDTAEKII